MYEIEKNIPIIKSRRKERKYPFLEMKIGDSFFVPLNGKKSGKIQACIMAAAHHHQDNKFSTRVIYEEDVVIGVRCWCVEKK